jgi:hypothetical protein
VNELWDLYSIARDPKKALKNVCAQYYDSNKTPNRGQFVIWSHRSEDKDAIALKDFIISEKLGTVHETEAVANPSYSKDHLNKMWTWTVNPTALRAWHDTHNAPQKAEEKPVGMVM